MAWVGLTFLCNKCSFGRHKHGYKWSNFTWKNIWLLAAMTFAGILKNYPVVWFQSVIWHPCWLVIAPQPSLICHIKYTCQPWTLVVFAETFTAETICWQLGCATLTQRGALWVLQQQHPIVWVDRLTELLPACSFYKINIPATDSPPLALPCDNAESGSWFKFPPNVVFLCKCTYV